MSKRPNTYKNKQPYKRRRYTPKQTARAAPGEMKYFDSELAVSQLQNSASWAGCMVDPNTTPVASINTLFAPTQGAGVNQRIGKACKLYKIKIKGTIQVPAQSNQTSADAGTTLRLLLVQDMQTNATQMTGTQLMTTGQSANTAVNSFQNIDNFGRFRVLHDKTIMLNNPNATYDGTDIEQMGFQRSFKMNVTFKQPVEVRFNATGGGTIADIVDNSFHMVANINVTDLNPYITYYARCCFKE